jgi:multiple sugar transport system ATP-binding protein
LLSDENFLVEVFPVQFEVVEPMGNETLLYFTLQGTQMIARGNPSQYYKAGDVYSLRINKNKIHFFDNESGIAI